MSSTLNWRPYDKGWKSLSDELKFVLRNRAMDSSINEIYGEDSLDYLHGLKDAGIKDAAKLIEAIEKYGDVELKEIF